MSQNLTYSFTVSESPEQAFAAISDVRGWWSGEFTGSAERLGDEFTYQYKDFHRSTQRVAAFEPHRRIVWHVTESHMTFLQDKAEWAGTDIIFDITPRDEGTEVRFTHRGITPNVECYGACSSGWGRLITDNLRQFIGTGARQPDVFA